MHNLDYDFFDNGTNWWESNGGLTRSINETIASFIATLTNCESIPQYAQLISQISVGTSIPVELTEGFRLMGTPVGSPTFASSLFDE